MVGEALAYVQGFGLKAIAVVLKRVQFDRIHVFTRQAEAAFACHNAFSLSGECN